MSGPALPRNRILVGDAATRLRALPDASVDCVITSPPYFGLRDYGHDGQLGTEAHVEQWVHGLRAVARELARVLKPGGACWFNVGDTYSRHPREGAAKKSLLLGPQRLALALLADGWLLRNQVVWAKSNPMPESIRDRLANRHEVLFLLTQQPGYYFDLDAIREPHQAVRKPLQGVRQIPVVYPPPAALPPRDTNRAGNGGLKRMLDTGRVGHPLGKNPGDVWPTATASYRGAHFATFPAELVRRPLLATCPEQVCAACGQPWPRSLQRLHGRLLATGPPRPECGCFVGGEAVSQPGVVLDPFLGSGTVALAAEAHGRDWVGIELNPAYAALAERRLADQRAASAAQKTTSKENNQET